MTSLRLLALALLAVPAAIPGAEKPALPTLTVGEEGERQRLELRELSVTVELEGWFAETVFELEYFNPEDRRREGEFVVRLPEGATVSTYALEVGDRMRRGVSVEKDRARRAYESIVRQQVDPGLVEREDDGIYRTRIFPIEPRKPKRVRIGFVHRLAKKGVYELPLAHEGKIDAFSCTVVDAAESPRIDGADVGDPERDSEGTWQWKLEDFSPAGTLTARSRLPEAGEPLVRVESAPDGAAHLLVQGRFGPDERSASTPDWEELTLLWDRSLSGHWRDHPAEFAALGELWEQLVEARVNLRLLGLSPSEPTRFDISGGDGSALEKRLREVTYHGAADFSSLPSLDGPVLLVTDGRISSPIWMPEEGARWDHVRILTTADRVAPGLLMAGARPIDPQEPGWLETLAGAGSGVRVTGLPKAERDVTVEGDRYIVSARLPGGFDAPVTIESPGSDVVELSPDSLQEEEETEEWNPVRRIWAQRRLAALERAGDRERTLAHATGERLVSDHTSLIVLERFQDHLTYEIPPPEPEQLARYRRALGKKHVKELARIVDSWERKRAWHERDFPWIDAELQREVSTVTTWVEAQRTAFPEGRLNREELRPYEEWLPSAREVLADRDDLDRAANLRKWQGRLEARVDALEAIRDRPHRSPVDEEGIAHVSVRGFVLHRDIQSAETPFLLRDALREAGGPSRFGSLSRVFLYRDASRTGYNLSSERYQPVPLRWGDMIVVERAPEPARAGEDFFDPFSETARRSSHRAAGEAPVFEESGEQPWAIDGLRQRPGALGGDDPGRERSESKERDGSQLPASFAPVPLPGDDGAHEELLDALKAAEAPAKRYRQHLREAGRKRLSLRTIIEVARFFSEHEQPDRVETVLTNLCEIRSNPFEATRELAYWLAEFGRAERAAEILTRLAAAAPDPASRALVHHDAGRLSGEAKSFRKCVESQLRSGEPSPLVPIALTDYFGEGGNAEGALEPFHEATLPSDLRIVVTSIGGEVEPEIVPPASLPIPTAAIADRIGFHRLDSARVDEWQLRRAWPGPYRLSLLEWSVDPAPVTLHLQVFVRWAGEKEERISRTVLMERPNRNIDVVDFGWEE